MAQPVDAHAWRVVWREDDGDRLVKHRLVSTVCVKIYGRQEASLRRVCVNPAERHHIVTLTIVPDLVLIGGRACVRRAFLVGHHESLYRENVASARLRKQFAEQDTARLNAARRVGSSQVCEQLREAVGNS